MILIQTFKHTSGGYGVAVNGKPLAQVYKSGNPTQSRDKAHSHARALLLFFESLNIPAESWCVTAVNCKRKGHQPEFSIDDTIPYDLSPDQHHKNQLAIAHLNKLKDILK